jgi:outer membrane receptor protein involved in Fe transport
MLRSICVLFVSIISFQAFSQNGTIAGRVTDHKSLEGVIGANVVIQGTSVGAATDLDGNFQISNVKPGIYVLVVSSITYKSQTIPDVGVESGSKTTLQIALVEDVAELEEIVITAKKEIATDMNLISAIRESKLVVSGISSEQIAKLPDNDAAQVMKRVPGITIVDNRFVMVRGVPERYNQVMINNLIAPSTEIDKRSFSFDLISSGALDQLLIYKSGTAELPGDFAGGVIQLITKQTPNEEYFNFGLGFGYRTGTTGKDFAQTKKSGTDFLGFDDGLRALPSEFPSVDALKNSDPYGQVRSNAGQSLENNFGYTTKKAPIDNGFNFGFAKNINFGRVKASNLTTVGYSRSYLYTTPTFKRYGEFDKLASTPSVINLDFIDNAYLNETKISAIHNWLFNLGENSKIEFKNLFVQLGEDKTILRSGTDITSLPGLYNNNAYHYLSRSIYSGQLQGTFKSADDRSTFNVLLGMNYVGRNEPDFRRFRRILDENTEEFRMILPPSANLFDAGRYYSSLKDKGFSHGLGFERKLKGEGKKVPTIKAGYFTEYKTRDFDARYVSYLYPGNFDQQKGYDLSFQPISDIFGKQNLFLKNQDGTLKEGFNLQEGTRDSDSYEGKNLLLAGYASGYLPLGNFDLTAGFRLEHNDQDLITYRGDSLVNNVITSPLPSLNLAYNLSDRSLIRLAYSKTVNRPEFRELAPFLFYQFEYNLNIGGKRDLKTAKIDNIDLRWEMYPNPGELISFGAFYKYFQDPIEFVQVNAGGNLQFSYQNAPKAYVYGLELELRKSLASLGVSRILRNTSINLNSSLIKSEVDMGEGIIFQERRRPLQGQSPYVINFGAYYNDTEKGFSMNLGYNIFGNRIFSVGSQLFPSWVERPRSGMDFQIAKNIGAMELKLNIQNVLNATYRIYQDNDESESIDEKIDDPVQIYRTGSLYSLAISWKFLKKN